MDNRLSVLWTAFVSSAGLVVLTMIKLDLFCQYRTNTVNDIHARKMLLQAYLAEWENRLKSFGSAEEFIHQNMRTSSRQNNGEVPVDDNGAFSPPMILKTRILPSSFSNRGFFMCAMQGYKLHIFRLKTGHHLSNDATMQHTAWIGWDFLF